ncbi:MAG: ferrous iron transport protein B [Planctomycetia bacterium]|nr:ferrous iron transport protein B [Planctomycetia bacterium]
MFSSSSEFLVAVVGQPNSGKSTIFTSLTSVHQEVGNYPGLTVDAKSGHYHDEGYRIEVIDLPGTYSFCGSSPEERTVKNLLLVERPEVVLLVLDASNFRRHLSFALELLEMQLPTIICLNFMDVAKRRGILIDPEKLERISGMPVVSMIGAKGDGIRSLRETVVAVGRQNQHTPGSWLIDYGPELEKVLKQVEERIRANSHLTEDFSPRWLAVKLLENDREARRFVEHHTHDDTWKDLLDFAADQVDLFLLSHNGSAKKRILERRIELADQINTEVESRTKPRRFHFSDRIDAIACHFLFGPLLLLLIMCLIFQLTFRIADGWNWFPVFSELGIDWTTPVQFLAALFHQWIPDALARWFSLEPGPLRSFIDHGVLAGMGGVIQFVPVIFIMFTLLAILEQSGYIARVAMIMDGFMRRFGLQGQSILPLVLGGGLSGGCAVPAIMAARSIPNFRQRLLTILVIPMLNCGGKLPVYAMLIAAFFPNRQGLTMASVVFFSWAVALFSSWLLGKTLVRGQELPLLLEIPSYQFPKFREVFATAARQSSEFLKKAGTIILLANIILWFLMSYPRPEPLVHNQRDSRGRQVNEDTFDIRNSYAASIGRTLEPIGKFAGFDWKTNVALIGGLATKELIVSSTITLYGAEAQENLQNGKQSSASDLSSENRDLISEQESKNLVSVLKDNARHSSPWKGFALLVFIMLYAPCSGTLVAIYRMTGSLKWVAVSMIYNTSLAFILAVLIYQIGNL